VNTEFTRLANHFLGHQHLNLIPFGHLLDKRSAKSPINEYPFDLLQQRMVGQFRPPGQGTLPVVSVRRQHQRGQGGPSGVDKEKPLAAFD